MPAAHSTQLVLEDIDAYFPAEQSWQEDAPTPEYFPETHSVQLDDPVSEYDPEEHSAHLVSVPEEYFPAGQYADAEDENKLSSGGVWSDAECDRVSRDEWNCILREKDDLENEECKEKVGEEEGDMLCSGGICGDAECD